MKLKKKKKGVFIKKDAGNVPFNNGVFNSGFCGGVAESFSLTEASHQIIKYKGFEIEHVRDYDWDGYFINKKDLYQKEFKSEAAVKRYIDNNLVESVLNEYNYPVGKVEGKNIFDTHYTDIPYYNEILNKPQYGVEKYNVKVHLEQMSPREYIEKCAEIFNKSFDDMIRQVEYDSGIIQELKDVIQVKKEQFPLTLLDYHENTQEGRHRMYVAGELFGWDTKFPVAIFETADLDRKKADEKEKEDEQTLYKIRRAVIDTFQYTFNSVEDFKEELQWKLNRRFYEDDVPFELRREGDQFVVTVGGVSFAFDVDNIEFTDQDSSIDVDDEFDLDDLL